MYFRWLFLLFFFSLSLFASDAKREGGCPGMLGGIAPALRILDPESLPVYAWRAARIRSEVGYWLSHPDYANRNRIPVSGIELDEAFASWPWPHADRNKLQSLYRAAESLEYLVEFTRLFSEPVLSSQGAMNRMMLLDLWNRVETTLIARRGFASARNPERETRSRGIARALIATRSVPIYFRLWLRSHLDTVDFYALPLAGPFQELVNDLYLTYKVGM